MFFRIDRSLAALGLCVWLCAAGVARAQTPGVRLLPPVIELESEPTLPFLVRAWSSENGAPQDSVNSIVQTRDGHLWMGTFAGLTRFDGLTFHTFTSSNTPGFRADRIHALHEDRDGTLWIGTEREGVFMLRDGVFSAPDWSANLLDGQVWTIHEARDGALWLGGTSIATRVDPDGRLTTFTPREGLPDGEVYSIAETADGVIWIGGWQAAGMAFVDGLTLRRSPALAPLANAWIGAIHAAPRGGFWVGTDIGLFRAAGDVVTFVPLPGLSGRTSIRKIVTEPSGGLWIGTSEGVCHVDEDSVVVCHGRGSGVAELDVRALRIDRGGSLWIGTHPGVLVQFKPRRAITTYTPSRYPMNFLPVVSDGADGMWVGSVCEGLFHFRNGVFEHYGWPQGMPYYCIWSLHRDPDDTLWIGDSRGGLIRVRDGYVTALAEAGPAINAIARDRAGTLWIGTNEAVKRLLPDQTFQSYTPPDGSAAVHFITDRRAGGLWLGTTAGLFAFDDGTFTRQSTGEGLPNHGVRAVLEDPDGTVWIGTDGGGLTRLKNDRVTQYTPANGLFDEVVARILDDGRGRLWMSGNRGVFRVERSELDSVAEGRSSWVTSVWYDLSDGMKSSEPPGAGQPAGWRAPDGRLWFPTRASLVVIDPSAPINPQPPPVSITSVVVDRVASAPSGELVLPAGAHNLEIHYTGISLDAPQKVQFRYRLVGYDEEWVEAGGRRVAYYTGLPPGGYRFEMRARNEDGVWSTESAALSVQQVPYAYQTAWFASLCGVGFVVAGAASYRIRLRSLMRRTRELETTVAVRTAEVVQKSQQMEETHHALIAAHDLLAEGHGQLAKSHEDLLAVLNQMRLGVSIVDRDGVVQFLNVTAQQGLGRTPEEAMGRPWPEMLPLSDADRARVDALMVQPHAERTRVPVRVDLGGGQRNWMEIDVRDDPRDASRRILCFHDVTELYDLQRLLDGGAQFQGLIGDTAAMTMVYRQIRDVALVDSTVVIEGETGTGKELVARAIHERSARKTRPFLAINCAGLTESLLASQLFGHQRGAFTGAVADQLGLFEAANGGTLLLDEIGDIPLNVQASLLRVLQEREITRLGESKPRKIDVRILAATHRDLENEVAAGRLRQDLFYRLRIVRIHVPPLRERRDDIPVLVAWFLGQMRNMNHSRVFEVSGAAMDRLLSHPWPGNVRELKGTIDSAAVSATGSILEVTDLPVDFLKAAPHSAGPSLDPRHHAHVRQALAQTRGNRAAAARLLGISRPTLYRRLRELGLDASEAS